jgi:hypothetical protein
LCERRERAFHQGGTDGSGKMSFADAAGTEEQDVCASLDPCISLREGHEMCFADAGNGGEVEIGEGFAIGQMGFVHMASDPTGGSFENLMLAEGCQEAGCAPSLAIGAFAQILPEAGNGGQSQRRQHQW